MVSLLCKIGWNCKISVEHFGNYVKDMRSYSIKGGCDEKIVGRDGLLVGARLEARRHKGDLNYTWS